LGTTAYLLVMASAGYYLKLYGGEWGAVTQIVFLFGAFLLLALVLFSGHIRASVRIFISKHFYSNAYDYREEWLRFIATLSDSGGGLSLEERVIRALAQVVESPGGVLWMREPTGRFSWRASCDAEDMATPAIDGHDPVIQFLQRKEWIVNLQEMATMPEVYKGFNKPPWLERCANAWLLIPLFHRGNKMDGMVLLTLTQIPFAWNWEVIDMLKTTGRLAASYLALEYAAKDLAEARQFDGFNRLSAFVIHDLKNLVAQLSLVVRNAEKHQDNPEFMRDAIQTVNHAVGKMNALMTQLRNSSSAVTTTECDLSALLREVAEARKKQLPPPQCELGKNPIMVSANRGRLAAALEHVIQNGQEAAGKQGRVVVRLRADDKQTAWIEVEDNGCGMDDHFIRTRLFKPFDTTKGLTGMGIGAYESREYVRSLGGELSVHSEPGKGSLFRFQIPLARTNLSFH
jgi:putative PEP-CTERM system histidine kinase